MIANVMWIMFWLLSISGNLMLRSRTTDNIIRLYFLLVVVCNATGVIYYITVLIKGCL